MGMKTGYTMIYTNNAKEYAKMNTALYNQIKERKHNVDWDNVQVLHSIISLKGVLE